MTKRATKRSPEGMERYDCLMILPETAHKLKRLNS